MTKTKKRTKYIYIIGVLILLFFFAGEKKTDGEPCVGESTCGTDGLVGDPFCYLGDVYQDYTDFSCVGMGDYVKFRTSSLTFGSGVGVAYTPHSCGSPLFTYGATSGACTEHRCTDDDHIDVIVGAGLHIKLWYDSSERVCICDTDPGTYARRYTSSDFDASKVSDSVLSIDPALELDCSIDGTCQSDTDPVLIENCVEGCIDGACYTSACDEDTDCGIDGFDGDPYCMDGDIYQDYKEYTCNLPGQAGAYCSEDTTQSMTVECDYGCTAGECNNQPDCNEDDDCTEDHYTGQYFCNGNLLVQNFKDYYCEYPGTPNSKCVFELEQHTVQTCAYGCDDGACLSAPECSSADDCGDDGFVGEEYCLSDNVYQDYTTYTCSSPGTQSAQCSESTSAELKETCDLGCDNGECNLPINCNNDNECSEGSSGGSSPYCNNDNVYVDTREYTCHFPGATNSYCSEEDITSLHEQCTGYGCKNAICCNTVADSEQCDGSISNTEIFDAGDNYVVGSVSRDELGISIKEWAGG